jgi:predicted metal-dependent peptidase
MRAEEESTAADKLTRSRVKLILAHPFFGTLSLRLKLMPGDLPTMATDGTRIVYNPMFVSALRPAEVEGTLAHEVLHCSLGHHCRRGGRDLELWNQATDYAINPLLIANGFALPAGALIDPAFDNLSAEDIYARLLQQSGGTAGSNQAAQQAPAGEGAPGTTAPASSNGAAKTGASSCCPPAPEQTDGVDETSDHPARPGGFGEVWDATDEQGHAASPAETRRQEHEWAIATEQALRAAKSCGCEPAGLERPLSESRQSQQDWRAILRDFVAATAPADYRWTPPNRRYIASGLYLPSVERQGVGELVLAVDTSGSIGRRELEQFAGEISSISDEVQPEGIHVVYCDAAVQSIQHFGSAEPVQLEPKGGGGTDFRPAFAWVTENGITPACFIYLTDLCCDSYPEVPEYPVLWVTDSRRIAPFGETTRIGLD